MPKRWLLGIAGSIGGLLLWALLARELAGGQGHIKRLAGPIDVGRAVVGYVLADFVSDLWASLEVFFGEWVVGGFLAAATGLLLGRVPLAGRMFLPVIEAIRPVSSIAWVPLSVVWFGLGYTSKAFVVGLAVYLVVIVYAVDGSARIPRDLERAADMLGMSAWHRMRYLVVPATLNEVLIGLRVALTAGWGTVIVAELVAANTGLGEHLVSAQQSYDIETVMASMACFGAVGFVLNSVFVVLQDRILPWQRKGDRR